MATGDFKFPDEIDGAEEKGQEQDIEISVQADDDVEINVVDDTPERDRGRKPLDREVTDPTEEELDSYTEGVKKRLKELTHARHDERRAKEALAREKEEQERLLLALLEENKALKKNLKNGYKFTPSQRANTFWHELTHAILHDMDSELNYDEKFVSAFSDRLSQAVETAVL